MVLKDGKIPKKPKGILKNPGPISSSFPDKQHLQWDESNLALTEIQKDSLMKITEPKTPYVWYNETDDTESDIPGLDLNGHMDSPTSSSRPTSPINIVASGSSSRRASSSSNRSTSFSLPKKELGDKGEVEVEEATDEQSAAEHEEFVRARKRHYAKEGEAMKRATLFPTHDEEEAASNNHSECGSTASADDVAEQSNGDVNGVTHHANA